MLPLGDSFGETDCGTVMNEISDTIADKRPGSGPPKAPADKSADKTADKIGGKSGNGEARKPDHPRRRSHGNTLKPIDIDPTDFRGLSYERYLTRILATLEEVRDERFDFYYGLVKRHAKWGLGLKTWLSLMAAVAVFLTALAALARLYAQDGAPLLGVPLDIWFFGAALVLYAAMAAMALYDKGTDKTAAYFRSLGTVMAIRDLWTRLIFELFNEAAVTPAPGSEDEQAAIARVNDLARAFVIDLDTISKDELGTWQTEHLASLKELEAAIEKGRADAKAGFEEARTAQRAYQAKQDASQAIVSFKISPDFRDTVSVRVDGREVERTHLSQFSVGRLSPGVVTIDAKASAQDGTPLAASFAQELKTGIQTVEITLA